MKKDSFFLKKKGMTHTHTHKHIFEAKFHALALTSSFGSLKLCVQGETFHTFNILKSKYCEIQ